jgi:hypothetical protein
MARMGITFRGIAARDTNDEGRAAFIRPLSMGRAGPHYNDVVFRPLAVFGPAGVDQRPARVELSRKDLARLLMQIPVSELGADDKLHKAWSTVVDHLNGEDA